MNIELHSVKNADLDFLLDLRRKTMRKYIVEIFEQEESSDIKRIMYAFDDIDIMPYQEKEVGMIK